MKIALMPSRCLPILLFPLISLSVLTATADEPQWTRFRGPNGTGACESGNFPATWTKDDYRWRVELPGIGYSSPVLWEDRLYLTSTIEEEARLFVLCLKAEDGSVLWKREVKTKPHPKYKANCDACATPAVDADRVYVAWATPDEHVAMALDQHTGKELWRHDLGPFVSEDGFGPSPVVIDDVVVLANDQDPGGKSSIVALDRKTGELRWETGRETAKAIFSTPCLFEPEGGKPQVIVLSTAHGITSLNPADGSKNWDLPDVFELRTTGSPLVTHGMVFGSTGAGTSGKYLVAARAGIPEKDIRPEVLYRVDKSAPYVITPVAKWPLVFIWSDKGVVTCIDGPTGKVHWRKRVGGNYLGSPVRIGDRIYCISNAGEVVVLAAAKEYELLARIDLGEESHSTPVPSGDVLYLRTLSHLIAVGAR